MRSHVKILSVVFAMGVAGFAGTVSAEETSGLIRKGLEAGKFRGLAVWTGMSRGQADESKGFDWSVVVPGLESRQLSGDLSGGGDQNAPEWKTLIISDDRRIRMVGREMLLKKQTETIQYLISVVKMPVQTGEEFYESGTFRNISIRLLGDLRSKDAVPVLVECIFPKAGQQSLVIFEESPFTPAGRALIEIGLPAVRPLVERLVSENVVPWKRELVKILVGIKGLQETELLLGKLAASERDSAKKESLEKTREVIQEPKFRKMLERLDSMRDTL